MSQPQSIPWLEASTIKGAIELQDERDNILTLIELFPIEQFVGDKIGLPQIIRNPTRVRHTTAGGRAMPVSREEIQLHEYAPSWIKLQDVITPEDKRRFYDALAPAVSGMERLVTARMATADTIIDRLASRLRSDLRTEIKALCAGALQGSYTYTRGTATQTVNLQLTALTNPGTAWDNAAATIAQDITDWINEFKAGNESGAPPTHVFYNPELIRSYFLGNTEFQTMIGGSAILSEWFIGLRAGRAGTNWLDEEGRIRDPLFNLTWVPVEGVHTLVSGSEADIWPTDKLTFARLPQAGPKWFMTFDQEQTPEPTWNVEVLAPREGEDVKNHAVTLFFNGLPGFERPDLVMTVDVVP